jgi:hypothetical protein
MTWPQFPATRLARRTERTDRAATVDPEPANMRAGSSPTARNEAGPHSALFCGRAGDRASPRHSPSVADAARCLSRCRWSRCSLRLCRCRRLLCTRCGLPGPLWPQSRWRRPARSRPEGATRTGHTRAEPWRDPRGQRAGRGVPAMPRSTAPARAGGPDLTRGRRTLEGITAELTAGRRYLRRPFQALDLTACLKQRDEEPARSGGGLQDRPAGTPVGRPPRQPARRERDCRRLLPSARPLTGRPALARSRRSGRGQSPG